MKVVSFGEFVTDDMIIRLLAKERGKYAAQRGRDNSRKNLSDKEKKELADRVKRDLNKDSLYKELDSMMPRRKDWINPGFKHRPRPPKGNGLKKKLYSKRVGKSRVYASIVKLRAETPDAEWVKKLEDFVKDIHLMAEGRHPIKLEAPKVSPQFKETDMETGSFIFRPICVYKDLKTKIILSLAYRYVVATFDSCFHRNMLFMRGVRYDGDGQWSVPNFQDAIRETLKYRKKHDKETIFVGECDIQKFYDIFNHDDILDCFEELYGVATKRTGVDPEIFAPFTKILKAYLDSYDYYHNVMKPNDPGNEVWKNVQIPNKEKQQLQNPIYRFKWVSDEKFIASGCYDAESLQAAKEGGKLGIPQGGALSGIIVNVVMQSIDKNIVAEKDPGRLFIRYCDDILLMHTDIAKCRQYLNTYYEGLRVHKLVPHPGHDVREFKNGSRTLAGYWDVKSKNVFKWGVGHGDASNWIAFVGYEINRNGAVRFRKDKIDKEFKRIASAYYSAIKSKKEDPEEILHALKKVSSHFDGDPVRTADRYALAQARRLDKYLVRKFYKAARKKGLQVTAKDDLERYADRVGL